MPRRALPLLLAVLAVAAACTGGQPAAAPAGQETPSPPAADGAARRPPPVQPLTGRRGATSSRPVLAVKIDNAPPALPQTGLDKADVVIEEEVEGGITRFVALFQSQAPKEVGPVRSGREVDAVLLPAFRPVLTTSGQAGVVERAFKKAGLLLIHDDQAPDIFRRDPSRAAPNNLYAATAPLFARGADQAPPTESVWDFDQEAPAGGRPARRADMAFSTFTSVTWTWTPRARSYRREQNGESHETAAGEQLSADNIVVMRVKARAGDRRDSAGNPTVELDVIGTGPAVVLRDGRAYRARWRKPSADEQLQWLDRSGEPLPLRPGRTYIELLRRDGDLTVD